MTTLFRNPFLIYVCAVQAFYLSSLPPGFENAASSWAYISYSDPTVAVIPDSFNRSIFQAPWASQTSNQELSQTNQLLNSTDFIAYDESFFDLIGPNATIEHVQELPFKIHEASCFNPNTKELFFAEWGPPSHSWQYLLDTQTNTLRNITTDPPIFNAHGCVFYKDEFYVVTDGSANATAMLVKIDPDTLTATTLLNNYYQQPFDSFNDLDIDPDGNFWITDDVSGYGRGLIPFFPDTVADVYFVNGTTMRPRVVSTTTGNSNGVAVSNSTGGLTVYLSDTGVATRFNNFGQILVGDNQFSRRDLSAFDVVPAGNGLLVNHRLLNNPISYFYDGIRVSRNGWIFGGAGEGVDVIDPYSGLTLGTIHVGGGQNVAVNVAFGEHELWIVGKGGVWHVSGISERLDRSW